MKLFEVYVDDEYRGDVEAKDDAAAKRIAKKGGLYKHGEGKALIVQYVADRPDRGKKTRRPNWRTKTKELRRRKPNPFAGLTPQPPHEDCDCISCLPHTY
ncbi:MAG: hypothetical protein GY769_20145 [bacterium]|nr:hypothetical protein [bacterium]